MHGLGKDGKPNLRSRNRPSSLMLDAEEEKRMNSMDAWIER
jgi:hypothetical protein